MPKQTTIFDGALKDKGYICPCCQQFCKTYTRSYNHNMAFVILALYRKQVFNFVHIERWLQTEGYPRCGDFSYNVHYGLLEKFVGEREDGSGRNGFYKLTGRGIAFAEGSHTVQAKFKIFNGKLQGFDGDWVDIHKVLGKRFDYNELMGKTETT